MDASELRALRQFIAGLDDQQLECRAANRHWAPGYLDLADPDSEFIALVPDPGYGGYHFEATCRRGCGVWWNFNIARKSGVVEARPRAHYPEGYLWPEDQGGPGRPMNAEERDVIRVMLIEEAFRRRKDRAAAAKRITFKAPK